MHIQICDRNPGLTKFFFLSCMLILYNSDTTVTLRRLACWLEHQTRDQKGCEFQSWQKWWENFLLPSQLCVRTLTRCLFHSRVTAAAHKRPRSLCQKCRWQVTPTHIHTLDPTKLVWADCAAVKA